MIETTETVETVEATESTTETKKGKVKEIQGRKFNLNSCKKYERKAFRFIQEQYPQYDVLKEFESNLRILDSKLTKVGSKLGMYQTKFQLITMFVDRIENANKKEYSMYSRSSSHLMPPKGMKIDLELHLTLIMIHEMTHAMQHAEGTPLSEVDTTRNEIEYLRQNHTDEYLQLITSQTKPLFRLNQRLKLKSDEIFRISGVRWKTKKLQWLYHLVDKNGEMKKTFEPIIAPEVIQIFKPKKKVKDQTVAG